MRLLLPASQFQRPAANDVGASSSVLPYDYQVARCDSVWQRPPEVQSGPQRSSSRHYAADDEPVAASLFSAACASKRALPRVSSKTLFRQWRAENQRWAQHAEAKNPVTHRVWLSTETFSTAASFSFFPSFREAINSSLRLEKGVKQPSNNCILL